MWFRNTNLNAQAQVNTAVDLGITAVQQKNLEIDRLREEAKQAVDQAAQNGSNSSSDVRRLKSQIRSLEDKNLEQAIELANAQNAINQWLIENEAFKRLGKKYSAKAGVSDQEFQKEFNETKQDAQEELGLKDMPVPAKKQPVKLIKLDYNNPEAMTKAGYYFHPNLKEWVKSPPDSKKLQNVKP